MTSTGKSHVRVSNSALIISKGKAVFISGNQDHPFCLPTQQQILGEQYPVRI